MHTYFNIDTQKDGIHFPGIRVVSGQGHHVAYGLGSGVEGSRGYRTLIQPIGGSPQDLGMDIRLLAETDPEHLLEPGQRGLRNLADSPDAEPGEVSGHPRTDPEHLVNRLRPQLVFNAVPRQSEDATFIFFSPRYRWRFWPVFYWS